jgi:hypothetical protein
LKFTKKQKEKLEQAKTLLAALGLPKAQYNNRSGWVLLALANIKPSDQWESASAPLLPTVSIMKFIRTEYGMDYKPNSRETIRRQTLHQFEQARIVDRNRDDPKRPTNSKDTNYSLTQAILEILAEYPKGDWLSKIQEYKDALPELTAQYDRVIDMNKIPIRLPNGEPVTLSPGKHNQLHADIVHEFCSRFIGAGGVLLYLGDTASSRKEGGKLMFLEADYLESLGIPPMAHDKLPDIVVYDGRVYVTAFPDRAEFRKNSANIAWETEVWIADNPDHMIHFNGERFLGPHTNSS